MSMPRSLATPLATGMSVPIRPQLIEYSVRPWMNGIETSMLQERGGEGRADEMRFKALAQYCQVRLPMIVAHRYARRFPDMLLRVQIWRCHWELPDLQSRIRRQHLADLLSPVPGRSVPQQ